ncbi:ATP synthase subunit I [Paraburkholderia hospita]|uniref:ATP synthase subunit I n=1 Tax=Paraburkholderia hospita TaxID=169430 RepID=UPI000B3476F5|nr:ATP synthase subunit I [Paraburkholderia hospita]OUL95658.1 ATP synthase subunit I [Paraburkholderia hospita]
MINTATSFLHRAIALAVAGLAVGMLAGAFHFVSLRWNTLYFASGRPAIAFAIQVARLVLTAVIFFLLAKAGAFALLAGIGGFIWTRSIALELGRARS